MPNEKHMLVLILLAVMTAALLVLFGSCVGASNSLEKLQTALNDMEQLFALDISSEVTQTDLYGTHTYSTNIKYIDTVEDGQKAYISINGEYFTSTTYFLDGFCVEDYGVLIVEQMSLATFLGNDNAPMIVVDLSDKNLDMVIKHSFLAGFNKFVLTINGEKLNDLFDGYFDELGILTYFNLEVLVDKSTNLVSKLTYNFGAVKLGHDVQLKIVSVVNATNEQVEIEIPDYLLTYLLSYKQGKSVVVTNQTPAFGTVTGDGKYPAGEDVTLVASEKEGYEFFAWYDGDTVLSYDFSFSFVMPDEDVFLTAKFREKMPYYHIVLFINDRDQGTVENFFGEPKTDEIVSLQALPNEGCVFLGWFENGDLVCEELVYEFVMPARDVYLNARFAGYVESYADSQNDQVKYFDVGYYNQIAFDSHSNQIVVGRGKTVDVYSADLTLKHSFDFPDAISSIDADSGVLAVGFASRTSMLLFDLTSKSKIGEVATDFAVSQVLIDGDVICLVDNFENGKMIFFSIEKQKVIKEMPSPAFAPILTLNRTDHLLYVAGALNMNCSLFYVNSQTGEILQQTEVFEGFEFEPPYFDGRFVQFFGATFEARTANMHSNSLLGFDYNIKGNFVASQTIFNTDTLSFVVDNTKLRQNIAVFDLNQEGSVFQFEFSVESILKLSKNKFLLTSNFNRFVALVDTTNMTELENIPFEPEENVFVIELEESYDFFATDKNFVYLVNQASYTLVVYDLSSLEKVFSHRFLIMPTCIDAFEGKLAVGLGDGRQIYVFDTTDWSFDIADTLQCATFVAFYCDLIIYSKDAVLHEMIGATAEVVQKTDVGFVLLNSQTKKVTIWRND